VIDVDYMQQWEPRILGLTARMQRDMTRGTRRHAARLQKAIDVLSVLFENWYVDDFFVTQRDMVLLLPGMGCHPVWELPKIPKRNQLETRTRLVRSLIERELRKDYRFPVLSTPARGEGVSASGYWLARSKYEADVYLDTRKRSILSGNDSAMDTWKASAQTFDAPDADFFDDLIERTTALEMSLSPAWLRGNQQTPVVESH